MGTQLDVFPFQEPTRTQQDIISSWLDLDDSAYTPIFQQELQDLENHLFHFENDPISSSSSSSLPIIPAAHEESSFMLDLYNFNADQQAGPDDDQNDQAYQPAILPVLEVQQCVEPDVCDTFLNDYDFGLISPTDLSPDSNNNINDQFCDNTTVSGFLNQLGDVEMSEEPMVVNTTANNMTDSNKTTDDDEDNEEGTDEDQRPKPGTLNCKNLVSERNRRKRLSQQLLSLRAIVPNITKMDKRSVLVDALSYLRNIHQETEKLQKELKEQQPRPKLSDLRESSQDNPCGTLRIPRTSASVALPKPIAQITE
ncbi:transcription factor FER-LIKE IRON DEFICIENCY-INDUCED TRANSCRIPTION FACTOR-like, partial [Thalictrum thalictroides]